jgi:hypothetical protein
MGHDWAAYTHCQVGEEHVRSVLDEFHNPTFTTGYPDCSYKGGLPGFVRVLDDRTLCIPDHDGNGMYRTWGNVLVNAMSDCCSWTSSTRSGYA